MIIYGSRMYGRRDSVKGWGYCDSCGSYSKTTSYNGRKWGHLYFIPIIPIGPRVRVLKECKNCSHGMHLPETDVPAFLETIRQGADIALTELIAGEKEFDDEGTMTPCAPCLAGSVEMLYCLSEPDYVRLTLAALKEKGLTYAYHLVNAGALEFQGDLEGAASSYQQASQCDPSDAHSLLSLGFVSMMKNDFQAAKLVYEKALELSEDKFTVLQILLTVYGSLKDYLKLSETYEECFKLVPEMAQDKKIKKAYKKACKKAGTQPALT